VLECGSGVLERGRRVLEWGRGMLERIRCTLELCSRIRDKKKRSKIKRRVRNHKIAIRSRMQKIRCIRKNGFMKNDIPVNKNGICVKVKQNVSFNT
jgi:hypothetical protein